VTGVEGYVESAAIGMLAGIFAAAERAGREPALPPPTTALGALLGHVTGGADSATFQPMNCNFGLFPPLPEDADVDAKGRPRIRGTDRRKLVTARALRDVGAWFAAGA
jgi:methylenetetrahydrofolate--tRNA-(uracil-5-)-methyltransferase